MSADPGGIVADAVVRGVVPGAALRYGRGAEGPVRGGDFGFGTSADSADSAALDSADPADDVIYDLASLTKVVATLPLVLRLVEAGEVGLDDPVVRYLPGFSGAGKEQVTVRQLLSHSSGLPAHREVWRLEGTAQDRFAAVLAEPLEAAPGSVVRYSDLGFIVLGRIVADVVGQPLDVAFADLVAAPLGMASTGYRPAGEHVAATEANWFDDPARQDPKVGVVHDENAESLGGVAGHAGLFGTAADIATYVWAGWLAAESPILGAGIRAEALRCQTAGLGAEGVRGLGWTLRGDSFDFMSDGWPSGGAGHTGFTGTSVAFDPESGIWCVLLTNAVLLGRENRTRELRRTLHAAVAAEYGKTPSPGADAGGAPDSRSSKITA